MCDPETPFGFVFAMSMTCWNGKTKFDDLDHLFIFLQVEAAVRCAKAWNI